MTSGEVYRSLGEYDPVLQSHYSLTSWRPGSGIRARQLLPRNLRHLVTVEPKNFLTEKIRILTYKRRPMAMICQSRRA